MAHEQEGICFDRRVRIFTADVQAPVPDMVREAVLREAESQAFSGRHILEIDRLHPRRGDSNFGPAHRIDRKRFRSSCRARTRDS